MTIKLKDTGTDSVDLTKEKKKSQWAKEIIDNLTVKLPIMTSISKGTKSTHFNFIGLARHAGMAEAFISKSNRFRTTSEVYRAALYLGMSLLYHLSKDEGTAEQKARADQIYKIIQTMESLDHSRMIIDQIVLSARNVIQCADSGVIDYEELSEKISTLVEALPTELQKVARKKIKRIMKGDKIVDLVETRIWRGAKGMKKRGV
jgi:hypothetical protein